MRVMHEMERFVVVMRALLIGGPKVESVEKWSRKAAASWWGMRRVGVREYVRVGVRESGGA